MRLVIIATAVAAVSLAACGRKPEKGPETVTVSENGYTVTTRTGDVVSTQTAVPAPPAVPAAPGAPPAPTALSMPDYAPLYPGATVKATSTTINNGHQIGSVTYLTAATPKAVIDFYTPKVSAAGFAGSAMNIGVGEMYAATDAAQQRSMQVIATAEKAGTAVVLTWTSPKS